MLPSEVLQRLLLVGGWLCLYGNPVRPPDIELEQDRDCYGTCAGTPPKNSSVQEWKAGVGGGRAADPRARPEGTGWPPAPQAGNRGSGDAGSGPSRVGGDEERQVGSREEASARSPPGGDPASVTAAPPSSSTAGGDSEEEEPGEPLRDKEPGPELAPTAEGLQAASPSPPRSPVPPMVFVSLQTSTPLSAWGREGPPTPSVQEPLLPDMGANLMPREDGPESLWTEATRSGGSK